MGTVEVRGRGGQSAGHDKAAVLMNSHKIKPVSTLAWTGKGRGDGGCQIKIK